MQPVFCNILIHNRLQNGPFDNAKRAVLDNSFSMCTAKDVFCNKTLPTETSFANP